SNEGTWTDTFIVTIYPDNETPLPNLVYQSHYYVQAGEDDDDLPEGGESIRMPIEILNSGVAKANGVSATISTTDPSITITDDFEYYPPISPSNDKWSDYNFNFDIAPGITQARFVEFAIEMNSDEGTWIDFFSLEIFPDNSLLMPELVYFDHEIDDTDSDESDGDGIPESGESVQLPVRIYNEGNGMANNVSAVLSCDDPHIQLVDINENYGDIDALETEWSNYSYDFVISPNCPAKDVMFTLEITSDEGSWTSYFAISISEPDSKDMTYPNPSNGTFKVLSTTLDGSYKYQLLDISGNEIHNGEVFIANHHEPVMKFDGLVTGIYFLKLDNGTEIRMQKIIIQ
ncbi:T9SS type A sorting domain-containing protein, partial [Lentimicrobium sp. L6]